MSCRLWLVCLLLVEIVAGFPPPFRMEHEPIPLKFTRGDVAADHKALQEGRLYELLRLKELDLTTPNYYDLPVNNRRMLKIFSILNLDPVEQEKNVEEIKARIFSSIPRFNDKTEIDMRELKLLENGLWVRCYWLKVLPPLLQDDDQCSVKELQLLIDKL